VFKKSITRKLVILFFIVGVSCLIIVGVYSYYNAKKAILSRTLDQLTSIRVIKKRQVQTFFDERYKNLDFLARTDYVKNLFQLLSRKRNAEDTQHDWAADYFSSVREKIEIGVYGFINMYFVYSDGIEKTRIWEAGDSLIVPFRGDTLTGMMLKKFISPDNDYRPHIFDFVKRYEADTVPLCLMGVQVEQNDSNGVAILVLQVPIKAINEIMLEDNSENGLGRSGEIYLVGPDSLMRSNSRFIRNSVLNISVNTISVRNAFRNQVGSSLIDDYRTIAVLSSYDRLNIPGLDWVIMAEIDYDEAMIPIVSIRNDIAFLSLIICLFLFSIAHIISRTITQPIIRLKNAARDIGEGNLDISMKAGSKDEIGALTETFNVMSQQLREERRKRMMALYDGQELERQRISRELHDGLGQKLVAVKLLMESTSKLTDSDARKIIDEVKSDCITIIDEVRQISSNLAPNILKGSGLDVALKNLCYTIAVSARVSIEFSAYGDVFIPDPNTKMYIYRIVQEGLNNTIKHSQAEKVEVQLMGNTDFIIIVIADNGQGFDTGKSSTGRGNGIYNMHERAKLLGGNLDIESEINLGTTIRLKIPKRTML
jgi:signal transduction histidine kinase